jgi:hypothetical protein
MDLMELKSVIYYYNKTKKRRMFPCVRKKVRMEGKKKELYVEYYYII